MNHDGEPIVCTFRLCGRVSQLALAAALAFASSASAQTQTDPDAAATMRWGPLAMKSTIALSNLGVDTNVFNLPESAGPQGDFTLTFSPTTNVWLRMGRTWIDGVAQVDWTYFNRFASERAANSTYRLGVSRTFNRLRFNANAARVSARDRPSSDIDLRSQRLERTYRGEVEYRVLSKTSLAGRVEDKKTTYDKDAFFLGRSLATELNETRTTKLFAIRHGWTPLTMLSLEIGRDNDRFFSQLRNADSTRVAGIITLQPSALVSGSAMVGFRHFAPWNSTIPRYRGAIASADLLYRMRGTTRLGVRVLRDVQFALDPRQPYSLETGATWSVQQQIFGPFDVLARMGASRSAYRDQAGAVVDVSNRVDRVQSFGGGAGYRLGTDKRIGFTIDHFKRVSNVDVRRFSGLRYGFSVTYER